MAQQPPWAAYTAFVQRPEKPFAPKPPSVFWPSSQQNQPREASITPMYECDPHAEGRPDSLDGLVEDLSNKFTTLETVRGIAQSPPTSIVGPFEGSRRSAIREEDDREASDESMSISCTARMQSVYDSRMADDHGDGDRICSMADVSTAEEHCGGDLWVAKEWGLQSHDHAYSAMSMGD